MKKAIAIITIITTLFCFVNFNVSADSTVSVLIPDYQVIIDNASVYYADSMYPFLNYKGITYLPMTYEYSRAMNLTTGWLDGTAFMVAYNPCYDKLPVYETVSNKKYNNAVIPTGYNIYVNGKKRDNSGAEYPLLNFRGVTYFPMTWEYAVDNFGWEINFEDNVFTVNTENNTAYRWSIEEKRENDTVLRLYYGKEITTDGGEIEYDYITEYYSMDNTTGNLVQLNDYAVNETNTPVNTQVDVTVEDGYVYYKEQKLDGIYINEATNEYIEANKGQETGYTIYASTSDSYSPLDVVDIRVNTYDYGVNMRLGKKDYTFIRANDVLLPLGPWKTVENVYEMNDDIYFNTVDYVQTIFRHYLQNRKMWKLTKDGQITEISYADYNSIKIVGKANGKLYLKCLWSPENSQEDSPFNVSLVNDGYYTFDGEGIRFVSPYIYSDFDIITNNGDIYAVNNILDRITKCEINPEYY